MNGAEDQKSCPNILVFHKLSPDFSFGSTNYTPKRFEQLLEILLDKGYRFESLTDVLSTRDPLGLSLGISFDDGYRHLLKSLPQLIKQFQLRPIIFMPTDLIGKENNWDYSSRFKPETHLCADEIKQFADLGVQFGSHGSSHSDLCKLSPEIVKVELEQSKSVLESITGQTIDYISYPFGRYNELVMLAVEQAGYNAGFTMSFPKAADNPMATGRKAIYGYDTPFAVLQKLGGGPLSKVERIKAALTNHLSAGNRIYEKLWAQAK